VLDEDGYLDEDFYESNIMSILSEYDKHTVYTDFKKDHSEKEIEKMAKENDGYF